jgi:RNA polymerase sigma-70 factor (ECF subfamily)
VEKEPDQGPGAVDDAPEIIAAPDDADWVRLVEKIRADDPEGMAELYRIFAKGIRFYLCRHLGPQELDDTVHDAFLIVIQAIRRGELREAERLMGFVRTVVRRQIASRIDKVVQNRRERAELDSDALLTDSRYDPERSAIARQQQDIMVSILRSISNRDREILTRFYLLEQTQEQICVEMQLSETQFRLLKSRAKARFGELGKQQFSARKIASILLRRFARPRH